MELGASSLKEMLYWMVLSRRLEERITILFREGRLSGHHHPGLGQEAVNVGVCYAMGPDDYVLLTHRGKAPALMRGIGLKELMAGYYGKKEGLGGGRVPTGSHMYGDLSRHILPMPGIIGSGIPLAVGAALGLKLKKSNSVVIDFFGDGAANRGDFHEGLNLAASMKLPVIFVLVNNGYSISFSVKKATGLRKLYIRAKGYGIPGINLDGNDVRAVFRETLKAIERARKGEGPTLIECMVHRWTGHSISDADIYRDDTEKREGEKKDPVVRFRNDLFSGGIISAVEYEEIEKKVHNEIEEAIRYCEMECTDPDPSELIKGVYCKSNLK